MGVLKVEIDTRDPDEALAFFRGAYQGGDLRVADKDRFRFSAGAVGDERFSVGHLFEAAAGRSAMGQQDDFVAAEARRPFTIDARGSSGAMTRPWLAPVEGARGAWPEALDLRTASIRIDDLNRTAQEHYGASGLRIVFAGSEPIDRAHAELWKATTAHLRAMLQTQEVLEASIIRSALYNALAAAMLSTFPNNTMDIRAAHDGAYAPSSTVRRAIDYIESNVDQPITLADIARASRLSARGLQAAFRRQTGFTPMQYLRRARMQGARVDLLAADSTRDAVAVIARRWGFAHVGRFAVEYRETYGESPSRTLRG